jgi:hypothetical protein
VFLFWRLKLPILWPCEVTFRFYSSGETNDDYDSRFIITQSDNTGAMFLVGIIIFVCSKPRHPHRYKWTKWTTVLFLWLNGKSTASRRVDLTTPNCKFIHSVCVTRGIPRVSEILLGQWDFFDKRSQKVPQGSNCTTANNQPTISLKLCVFNGFW